MARGDYVVVLTTMGADVDCAAFAETLVDERLAACVNVLPEMQSVYRWKGRLERVRERQIVIKTAASRVDRLLKRIGEIHPYEVPELLVLPVDGGGERYLEWIGECTNGEAGAASN